MEVFTVINVLCFYFSRPGQLAPPTLEMFSDSFWEAMTQDIQHATWSTHYTLHTTHLSSVIHHRLMTHDSSLTTNHSLVSCFVPLFCLWSLTLYCNQFHYCCFSLDCCLARALLLNTKLSYFFIFCFYNIKKNTFKIISSVR